MLSPRLQPEPQSPAHLPRLARSAAELGSVRESAPGKSNWPCWLLAVVRSLGSPRRLPGASTLFPPSLHGLTCAHPPTAARARSYTSVKIIKIFSWTVISAHSMACSFFLAARLGYCGAGAADSLQDSLLTVLYNRPGGLAPVCGHYNAAIWMEVEPGVRWSEIDVARARGAASCPPQPARSLARRAAAEAQTMTVRGRPPRRAARRPRAAPPRPLRLIRAPSSPLARSSRAACPADARSSRRLRAPSPPAEMPTATLYLRSLYWAFMTLTTVGHVDKIDHGTKAELVYAIALCMLSTVV